MIYANIVKRKDIKKRQYQKNDIVFPCCGGLTRTDDLWVMSPTSYQLLHSAMLYV